MTIPRDYWDPRGFGQPAQLLDSLLAAAGMTLMLKIITRPSTADHIAALGNSFAASIRAATGAVEPTAEERRHARAEQLVADFMADRITRSSFHLEVTHWPGGFPEELL